MIGLINESKNEVKDNNSLMLTPISPLSLTVPMGETETEELLPLSEAKTEFKVDAPLLPHSHDKSDDSLSPIAISSSVTITSSDPVTTSLLKQLKNEEMKRSIKICRTFGKIVAIGIGSMSGIPRYRIAQSLAGDYVVLGGLFAYGVLVAVPALSIWALFDVVNDLTPKSAEEKQLTNKRKSKLANAIRLIAIPTAGAILSWPLVYIGYIYNDNSYSMSAIIFANEWAINSSSVSQFLRKSLPTCFQSERQQAIEKLQQTISNSLVASHDILINLDLTKSSELLREISLFVSTGKGHEIIYLLLTLTTDEQRAHQVTLLSKYAKLKTKVYYGSHLFPATWAVVAFIISKLAAQQLSDNPFFQYLMAFIATGLAFIFEGKLASSASLWLCDTLIQRRLNIQLPTLAKRFSPKTYTILNITGIITAFLTFGLRVKVALDLLPAGAFIVLVTPIIIGTTIYKAAAITSLVNNFIEYTYQQFASNEIRDIAIFSERFSNFLNVLKVASPQAFEHFLSTLDVRRLTQILGEESELVRLLTTYKVSLLVDSTQAQQPQPPQRFTWIKTSWASFWNTRQIAAPIPQSDAQELKAIEVHNKNTNEFARTSRCVIL